jgi:hypothetical protein
MCQTSIKCLVSTKALKDSGVNWQVLVVILIVLHPNDVILNRDTYLELLLLLNDLQAADFLEAV